MSVSMLCVCVWGVVWGLGGCGCVGVQVCVSSVCKWVWVLVCVCSGMRAMEYVKIRKEPCVSSPITSFFRQSTLVFTAVYARANQPAVSSIVRFF